MKTSKLNRWYRIHEADEKREAFSWIWNDEVLEKIKSRKFYSKDKDSPTHYVDHRSHVEKGSSTRIRILSKTMETMNPREREELSRSSPYHSREFCHKTLEKRPDFGWYRKTLSLRTKIQNKTTTYVRGDVTYEDCNYQALNWDIQRYQASYWHQG